MLLGLGKEEQPEFTLFADIHVVNIPMVNFKLEVTERRVRKRCAVAYIL